MGTEDKSKAKQADINQTMKFSIGASDNRTVHDIILEVYRSLSSKGYDPINQIVGYIISGDPTYITSYNNARYLISRLERDEILEEMVSYYIKEQSE